MLTLMKKKKKKKKVLWIHHPFFMIFCSNEYSKLMNFLLNFLWKFYRFWCGDLLTIYIGSYGESHALIWNVSSCWVRDNVIHKWIWQYLFSEHTSAQKIVKLLEWINIKNLIGCTEINKLITDWASTSVIEYSQEGKPFKLVLIWKNAECIGVKL